VGPERLTSAFVCAFGLMLGLVACGGGARATGEAGERATGPTRPRHAQIFRALTGREKKAIAERFRARNGSGWLIGGEERGRAEPLDIDSFAGFVRRAFLRGAPQAGGGPGAEEDVVGKARAFVRANADLLGVPLREADALDVAPLELEPALRPGPATRWLARLVGHYPTRGYEAFHDLENVVDLWVFVDDDREVRLFMNFSRLHPALFIDTRVSVPEEDPRIVAKLLGRQVFAVEDDPSRPNAPVRLLKRIPLGSIAASDIRRRELTIHAAEGPAHAWLTYRLAYRVLVERLDSAQAHYFFWYVVDADDGTVIGDAPPPRVSAEGGAQNANRVVPMVPPAVAASLGTPTMSSAP
jgi:hypothetical protein